MAQQTTTQTTTIIDDLQYVSFKILDLTKKYNLPENDVIEINDYLLKIYKKVNNPSPHTPPPQEPEGPPPPEPKNPAAEFVAPVVDLPSFPSNAFEEVESPKNGIDEMALYSKDASTGCNPL